MLASFIRCQKDESDLTKIQNNAHMCGMPSHNKFLFKAPTVPSTKAPQTFINTSFEGDPPSALWGFSKTQGFRRKDFLS